MIDKLIEQFSDLSDPRCLGKVERRLLDILVIAICAVIACAESWEDIALYGRSKLPWLRQFLALPNGIPSHDTFRRVFMLIDPQAFESCFTNGVGTLAAPGEREVVSIDGKTLRGSLDRSREQSPLHWVNAWASERRLALGQRRVDSTSNEITAIPALLDSLALGNTRVTLDAMGCQKDIAQRVVDREADSLLVFKANHGNDHAAVRSHFERHCFGRGATVGPALDAFDEGHGRRVGRRVFADPRAASLETLKDWPKLKTVLAVEAIRSVDGSDKVEVEMRYFLSSFAGDPSILAQAIRRHWSIKNNLHWVLDVTFRVDDCRIRDAIAARNFALLRKIAINRLTQDRSTQASLRGKRKKAAWDDNYMLQLLQTHFMR